MRGVVRRRTIVGRAENQDPACSGFADVIVVGASLVAKPLTSARSATRAARILRAARFDRRVPAAACCVGPRQACGVAAFEDAAATAARERTAVLLGAQAHLDLEAVWLDRRRFLQTI
jgi:hypothetical protein